MQHRGRRFLGIAIVILVIACLIQPAIISMLIVLIFVGDIPGTSITIPAWLSLSIFATALIIGLRAVLVAPRYRPIPTLTDRFHRTIARYRVIKLTTTPTRVSLSRRIASMIRRLRKEPEAVNAEA